MQEQHGRKASRMPGGFLAGVIEGFYGAPWTQVERFELFDWLAGWGLNTYLYAPKDDLKHRAGWREPYAEAEREDLGELVQACHHRRLRFIYALSPGLDIQYSNPSDLDALRRRFQQMLDLGCADFCLLFDDIPDRMASADQERWGSLAAAQAAVANEMFRWTRAREAGSQFLLCPTPYCDRMARAGLGGADYLSILGRELLPEVQVFWTGPEIISREITAGRVAELTSVLRRKPLIWDNLHANDYDGRRFFCGPYAGRPRELRETVSGLLLNPNCELPLNFVPLFTLAEFIHGDGVWDARAAYRRGLEAWRERFAVTRQALDPETFAVFADCYYLPHEEGPLAEDLYQRWRRLLARPPADWGEEAGLLRRQVTQLREFCAGLAELRHRPLFHALSRRAWDLREEMDLIERALDANGAGARFVSFKSDSHLPLTYRGGVVARLQRLLTPGEDGAFAPASGVTVGRQPSKQKEWSS